MEIQTEKQLFIEHTIEEKINNWCLYHFKEDLERARGVIMYYAKEGYDIEIYKEIYNIIREYPDQFSQLMANLYEEVTI